MTLISEASLEDVPAAARLQSVAIADRVMTPAGLLHFVSTVPARARRRSWKAEVDGELVAWAAAGLTWESAEPGAASAGVLVHPDFRKRGIGGDLFEHVEAHLSELGAMRVSAGGADSDSSRRFAQARGFRETFRQRVSSLDLRTLPPPPEPPAGVELRPFSAFADDPRPIYDLDAETSRDIPLDQPVEDVRWEEWLERYWRMPMIDHEASLVLLVDGEPASFTIVGADHETGRAESGMTGTRARFRGRGFAKLVKWHSLAQAAERGIVTALTENDETNRAMLAVNEQLGYRPSSTRVTFSRP